MMNLFKTVEQKPKSAVTKSDKTPKKSKTTYKIPSDYLRIGASGKRSEQGSVLAKKRSRTRVRPVRRSGASQAGNVPAQLVSRGPTQH
jgi:hypothetical protein